MKRPGKPGRMIIIVNLNPLRMVQKLQSCFNSSIVQDLYQIGNNVSFNMAVSLDVLIESKKARNFFDENIFSSNEI